MKVGIQLAVVLFLVIHACVVTAQLNFVEWQKSYGGSEYDFAYDIKQLSDGGYIIAGYTLSDDGDVSLSYGFQDFWILRIDSAGTIIWERTYGGSDIDQALSIEPTPDDGFIVAGTTLSNDVDVSGNHGYYDMWVLKLTSDGDITWQKTYGGSSNETGYDIIPTSDGGFMLVGLTTSTDGDVSENDGGIDVWAVKLNSAGAIQWEKTFGGTENDIGFAVVQTTDGGYMIGAEVGSDDGDVTGFQGGIDFWLLKLDGDGNLLWQKTMGGSQGDGIRSVQQTTDGGFILGGWTTSDDGDVSGLNGKTDAWVVKTDIHGNILWERALGTGSEEYGTSVSHTMDGGYILSGAIMPLYDTLDQEFDFWAVKLDPMGVTTWSKSYGGSGNEMSFMIQQTMDEGFIMAGFSDSNDGDVSGNHGDADMWVVKLGEGFPEVINVNIIDTTVVTEAGLYAYATVYLSGPSDEVVKVTYKTKNGTALKGSDYVAATGIVRFLPGQTSTYIRVTIKADVVPEPDEYFLIRLSDPVNAELLQDVGRVIITEPAGGQNSVGVIQDVESYLPARNFTEEPILPNPQSRRSALRILHDSSGDLEILLTDEEGKIYLNRKRYANDWQMSGLNTGLYFYRIRYNDKNDFPVEISGKVFITD